MRNSMTFHNDTVSRPISSPLRNFELLAASLLNWVNLLDEKYRQARQMEELTNDQRLDMGMPLRIDPPRLPDTGW